MMVFLLTLLALPAGHAEEEVDLIIDVVSTAEQARQDLHEQLRNLGYRRPKWRKDRAVYHNHQLWKPSVHVLHDGRLLLRRAPVHIGPPGGTRSQSQLCASVLLGEDSEGKPIAPKAVCLYLDGPLVGHRYMKGFKGRTMAAIADEAIRWREASAAAWHAEYVRVQLPERLLKMWMDAGSAAAGTEVLYEHFCSRTHTAQGADVRQAVQTVAGTLDLVGPHADSDAWSWPCDEP